MSSTNPPNPPNFNGINYNSAFWSSTAQQGLTYNQALKSFLAFPVAQGAETLFDTTVQGDLKIDGSGNGLTFPDNTTQTTAFIEANYAQLNTDNTFLSPYINTFQGSNTTVNGTIAPLQVSNKNTGEYGGLYVDPAPNYDITLYSNQSTNAGLTVRTPSNSFTINAVNTNIAEFLNPVNINNAQGLTTPILNVNTNGAIGQTNGNTYIYNNGPITSDGQIYFKCNDTSGNQIIPFQIYYDAIQANGLLNMTANNIVNVGALAGYNGNIACNTDLTMGTGNDIIGMGQNSTGYTQPTGTANTTIATTAFVNNSISANTFVDYTNISTSSQVPGFGMTILQSASNNMTFISTITATDIIGQGYAASFTITFPSALYPTGKTPTITMNNTTLVNSNNTLFVPIVQLSSQFQLFVNTFNNILVNGATYQLNINITYTF
jgi:hypothetical protein